MPKGLRAGATRSSVAMIGALILLVPGAARAETHTVRYVAHSGWQSATSGPQVRVPGPAPMVIAPMSGFSITPAGTTVKVTIADDLTPDGSFLFSICQRNEPHAADYHCGRGHDDRTTGDICYTGPKTLTGVTPGNPVEVIIFGATTPCPDSPTTGTMTIVG